MIARSDFFERSPEWWKDPLATPNDCLLCAFVSLRLIAADVPELLQNKHRMSDVPDSQLNRTEVLLKMLDMDIDRWLSRWLPACRQSTLELTPGTSGCADTTSRSRTVPRISGSVLCRSPSPSPVLYSTGSFVIVQG
jgi:hypothetical protein